MKRNWFNTYKAFGRDRVQTRWAPLCRRLSGFNPVIFATLVTELHQSSDTTPACFYAVEESDTSGIALGEANEVTSPYLSTAFAGKHSWSATSQDPTPRKRRPPDTTTVWMLADRTIHRGILHRGEWGMGGFQGQTRVHLPGFQPQLNHH